jgi:phosphate transport system substrate-binding protein
MNRTLRPAARGLPLLLAAVIVAAACGGGGSASNAGSLPETTLNASGATFPQAFYDESIIDFEDIEPNVTVNYAGGGSGKGRTDLQERQVDFAGSDAVVKEEDLAAYEGGELLYFPTVSAPITVGYNLSDVDGLQLSPDTIAGIFQREITRWDDPAIAADNPEAELPSSPISVARRADGSGTTENFTKFLAAAAPDRWELGTGSTVEWPADTQGAQGNAGVAGLISSTEGAIGYVDYSDAKAIGLAFAAIRNAAGRYVPPTLEGVSAALAATEINADLTYDPINAPGLDSYPIAAPTWILVYEVQPDRAKGEATRAFLRYVLTGGQELAPDIDYAPLPPELAARALAQLDQMVLPS